MGSSRQEYWSGLPCPPSGDFPDPGSNHVSYISCIGRRFSTTSATWEAIYCPKCASCSVMSDSLRPYGLQPASLLCPCDSPGKNTRVGCHSLLQGIFLTEGSNPDLLHCRQILYSLNHQGSPIYCPVLHHMT